MNLRALLCVAATAFSSAVPAADTSSELYAAETIITGQSNLAERQRGFRETLREVLVKISGNPRIREAAGLEAALARAETYAHDFEYEDRLKGIPIHDEQGTRDRSYIFRVRYNEAGINDLLAELGGKPWLRRPRLLVLLAVDSNFARFLLGSESRFGYGQRAALESSARRLGIPYVLPRWRPGDHSSVEVKRVAAGDAGLVADLQRRHGADATLTGNMSMTREASWNTEWTLHGGSNKVRWRIDGTNFDRAIMNGIEVAAAHLSGNAP